MSMKFLKNLFRRQGHEARSGGWQGSMSGQSFYGNLPVTPANAEGLAAVYSCVTAISSSLSTLPALVYRQEGKARNEASEGEIQALIKKGPNSYQTWPEFVEMLVAQTLLRGNGLIEIETEGGHVTGLRVIPWDWCNPMMLPSGVLLYDVYDQPGIYSPAQGRRRRLFQHQVIHIRDRSDDGIIGKSRLQRCASVIRSAQTVHDFAQSSFNNGFYPSGVIESLAMLSQAQRVEMNDAFTRSFSGAHNAARALVLDQGQTWKSMTVVSPEDAELLNSRKFTTEEICRLFQVPPPIIADYSHNTFTNSETAGRWFAQFCLLPWVRKIEASFNRALFDGTDFELTLDMSAFDRGSPESRWAAHAIAASNGILSVDEIREIEGWGPKPTNTEIPGTHTETPETVA
jgi:HK97 family phage portal protein